MFKKTVTYKNFDGVEKQKDFYFHLSKSDLLDMAVDKTFEKRLKAMVETEDQLAILRELKSLISLAIGIRTEDGERFIKNDEVRDMLMSSPAYDELLFELMTGPKAAEDFMLQLIPKDMQENMKKELKKATSTSPFSMPKEIQVTETIEDDTSDVTVDDIAKMSTEEVVAMMQRLQNKKN